MNRMVWASHAKWNLRRPRKEERIQTTASIRSLNPSSKDELDTQDGPSVTSHDAGSFAVRWTAAFDNSVATRSMGVREGSDQKRIKSRTRTPPAHLNFRSPGYTIPPGKSSEIVRRTPSETTGGSSR